MKTKKNASFDAMWDGPVTITESELTKKSLCNFNANLFVGCSHGCRFCYAASITNRQKVALARYGIVDPVAEWGGYSLPRSLDETKLLNSALKMNGIPDSELDPKGHRAVMMCTTTDPYSTVRLPDMKHVKALAEHTRYIRTRTLEVIRDYTSLKVRVQTRSPLAVQDFELFHSFGDRLLLGMSIPSMNEKLVRFYEPHAAAPRHRLETMRKAREAGLNVYVALAPTFPESDRDDLKATIKAIAEVEPVTLFHEPINRRGSNIANIEARARETGYPLAEGTFDSTENWARYSLEHLHWVEEIAGEEGLGNILHLWPDRDLEREVVKKMVKDREEHMAWLQKWWGRISEWPTGRKVLSVAG